MSMAWDLLFGFAGEERVGLGGVVDRRPSTLPFADLRKMEIAKAIARDPKLVLVDEPFAGLTSKETAAFSELITEMRDDGRAVMLVDHNVKSVAALVDRVFAMYVGERIVEGTAEEVMETKRCGVFTSVVAWRQRRAPNQLFGTLRLRFCRLKTSASLTARRKLSRTSQSMFIRVNSSLWSGLTARARRRSSTPFRECLPTRATFAGRGNP
jgi:ABC-type multidrug transport system ATPase subunit